MADRIALTLQEHTALTYLAEGRAATYRIAIACGAVKMASTRRMLERLENRGLVESICSTGGYRYWWGITGAGRKAIS